MISGERTDSLVLGVLEEPYCHLRNQSQSTKALWTPMKSTSPGSHCRIDFVYM